MSCINCESERIASVNAKVGDQVTVTTSEVDFDGYCESVPLEDLKIGSDDYIFFDYCLNCGFIQNHFPVATPQKDE